MSSGEAQEEYEEVQAELRKRDEEVSIVFLHSKTGASRVHRFMLY